MNKRNPTVEAILWLIGGVFVAFLAEQIWTSSGFLTFAFIAMAVAANSVLAKNT